MKNTKTKISSESLAAFRFADLSKYSLKQRIMIRLADWTIYGMINLLGKTVRFEIDGWEDFDDPVWGSFDKAYAERPAAISAIWHNRIFLTAYFWRRQGFTVMVSRSFDGEYIARAAQRLGYGVIRGSSTRGGSAALTEMVRLMRRQRSMALMVDGPKGPLYKAKPGVVRLAKKSGIPIVPMVIEAEKFWTVGSWDRLQIPKPFSRARILLARPIFVSATADGAELEEKLGVLQNKLDELVRAGEQWRKSIKK